MNTSISNINSDSVAHLKPEIWDVVNRQLIKKAISEFTHELILQPKVIEEKEHVNVYELSADDDTISYFFEAQKKALDHLYIKASSISKKQNGEEVALDALDFILELKIILGIPDNMLPTYMEEITSTLHGAAYKYANQKFRASELVNASFQDIETAMSEGHPCFVANNGRIGFNITDYQQYAPEMENTFSLVWVAGHKSKADFHSVEAYNYATLIKNELGEELTERFNQQLISAQVNPEDYIFMPVHPWQWNTKISTIFAQDIAQQYLIYLGEGKDKFSAQQSIRTLFNTSHPEKLYTKAALSILNMGFMRGLSPYYMSSTPVITKWVSELLEKDTFLNHTGFTMLAEVATVGYRNRYYETLGKTDAHNKMLSALWRESPFSKIKPTQQLMTMASFLHLDRDGNSFVVEMIKASNVTAEVWLQRYLQAYLTPLLHCLYAHQLVFMPHGENLIMVLENNIPVKALMKDITEEIAIFDKNTVLPEKAKRLYVEANYEIQALAILTDVFDCFFRFLSDILTSNAYAEEILWKEVAKCVKHYQNSQPQLQERFEKIDLFAPEFKKCCLNRLQLANTKHMLNLADPVESLQFNGVLKNPIAQYKNIPIAENEVEFVLAN